MSKLRDAHMSMSVDDFRQCILEARKEARQTRSQALKGLTPAEIREQGKREVEAIGEQGRRDREALKACDCDLPRVEFSDLSEAQAEVNRKLGITADVWARYSPSRN